MLVAVGGVKFHAVGFFLDTLIELVVRAAVLRHAQILRFGEAQNHDEQPVQQNQADSERQFLAESGSQLVVRNAGEGKGQEHENRADDGAGEEERNDGENHRNQEHPTVAPRDFAQQVRIEERDEASPAGLTGLFEDLPVTDDGQNRHHQGDHGNDHDEAKIHANHGRQHLCGIGIIHKFTPLNLIDAHLQQNNPWASARAALLTAL